jgi:NSS family neurotransmitter:Na+ symporter
MLRSITLGAVLKERESWKSKFGFTLAAVGSAVGLANLWRFPYLVGENGGAAFILLYVVCLFCIGIPIFLCEILLGRSSNKNPFGAYKLQSRNHSFWKGIGFVTIIIGLLVSSFYSVIAGWILGYFIEAVKGSFSTLTSNEAATGLFQSLVASPSWTVCMHFSFTFVCAVVLLSGVRKGIERGSKIMMPLLITILLVLCGHGLFSSGAKDALAFLFFPNWQLITTSSILIALGQAAFTLSLGQGTMITYGSYLRKDDNIITCAFPVALLDTGISLLAGIAIFSIVFTTGMAANSGEGLFFETLPVVFQQMPAGYILAILFFLLVVLAAVSSEISAMEPLIAYLVDEKKWPRKKAVVLCAFLTFIIGIPSALSTNLLAHVSFFGLTFFDALVFLVLNVLLPLSGLAVVVFVAWKWGVKKAVTELYSGAQKTLERQRWIKPYFIFSVRFLAPLLIIFVLLDALGVF